MDDIVSPPAMQRESSHSVIDLPDAAPGPGEAARRRSDSSPPLSAARGDALTGSDPPHAGAPETKGPPERGGGPLKLFLLGGVAMIIVAGGAAGYTYRRPLLEAVHRFEIAHGMSAVDHTAKVRLPAPVKSRAAPRGERLARASRAGRPFGAADQPDGVGAGIAVRDPCHRAGTQSGRCRDRWPQGWKVDSHRLLSPRAGRRGVARGFRGCPGRSGQADGRVRPGHDIRAGGGRSLGARSCGQTTRCRVFACPEQGRAGHCTTACGADDHAGVGGSRGGGDAGDRFASG